MAIDRNTLVKNGQLESDLPEMYDDEVYDEVCSYSFIYIYF